MRSALRTVAPSVLLAVQIGAQTYTAPAGIRPAVRRSSSAILPGGRVIAPLGEQHITGPGPFGIAVSLNGRTVVTANGGPDRYSLTVMERERSGPWTVRHLVAPKASKDDDPADHDQWRSVFMGIAFLGDKSVFASEGNSGRVRLVDLSTGGRRRTYDLNQGGFADSYTGDLAFDAQRGILYVVDQANFRLAAVDTRKHEVVGSLRLGRLPFAVALAADGRTAYVANIGMFEFQPVPGADRKRARETGLPFPAFGFPSTESERGTTARTASGEVAIPGLGDPNVRESNSVCVVDVSTPSAMAVKSFVRTGQPVGGDVAGGSSPSAVVAVEGKVFVSNAHNDSISVIDAGADRVRAEIPLRIPGLDNLRGVLPIGMAYDPKTGWLLVAEAGINAVAVIDAKKETVLGHLPAGWFPTSIAIHGTIVHVASARGLGQGPNHLSSPFSPDEFIGTHRRGSISTFEMPKPGDLRSHTRVVMQANGFVPRPETPAPLPATRHVVLIVKENRTFDEMFGDMALDPERNVVGLPALARFGGNGYVDGRNERLSIHSLEVAPNHRAIARRWAMSDNFYADSDVSVDGHHWLVGAYPNAWTQSTLMAAYGGQKKFALPTSAPGRLQFPESNSSVHPHEQPEPGTIWHHLERHGIPFRNFGEGFELAGIDEGPGLKPTGGRFLTNVPMPGPLFRNTSREYPGYNMNIPDQYRATQFIREIEEKYVKTGAELPRFIYIHLPNDHMARARPRDGYPYEASYVVDNDYALGRILEFLSGTPWWKSMAVFVTEDDAQGGRDHIDAHRTVLLAAGPYQKRGYVSHVNSSFPGLLKTVFRLLGIPPLNLFDAAASDLSDCFTRQPDFSPYRVLPVDRRIFDPDRARDPLDPDPAASPSLDDAGEIERQQGRSRRE